MKQLLTIFLCISLLGCNETKQSVIKTDDELSSNIKFLLEKYVKNEFDVYMDNDGTLEELYEKVEREHERLCA